MNTSPPTTPKSKTKSKPSFFSKLLQSPSRQRKLKSRTAEVQFAQARQGGGITNASPTSSPSPSNRRKEMMDVMLETSDLAEWFNELVRAEEERQRQEQEQLTQQVDADDEEQATSPCTPRQG
ncbi:expressed unknown protein [Seminavis robusta]|uniref:Uncharacterized protein n=1 Tax=Seminavis robusta TaxID=568900 RepID=A0A9N8H5Y9_9STRA|nr:expressed unknown protein [Seminavis robusta]|eukprot:Sro33_g021430.1 n/a (123) ;mRNA; f:76496-76864